METVKVSIVMNCFNSERFLREAIDSVFAQTYANWELIFWDNQSTDRSAAIFKSYHDPRCRYFYSEKHTVLGEARNLGVERASGEWITFLDCDDIMLPKKLAEQVKLIQEDQSGVLGLVYCRTRILGGTRNGQDYSLAFRDRPLPTGFALAPLLLVENFIAIPSALFRKDLFMRIGGVPSNFKRAEDYYLFAGILAHAPIKAWQDFGCEYRIHGSNLSYSHRENVAREIVVAIESFEKFLDHDSRSKIQHVKKQWLAKAGLYGMFERRRITLGLLLGFMKAGPFYALKLASMTLRNYLRLSLSARGSH